MTDSTSIAIIGIGLRVPGARTVDEFWQHLRDGVESISSFSDADTDKAGEHHTVRAGSVLEDVDQFDAGFFGFNPREAELMDPQHRLFLECAWEALEHAGYDSAHYARPVGVYAGVGMNTYLVNNLAPNRDLIEAVGSYQTTLGNDKDFVPTRVSYKLNLTGPSVSVQTACSSSLVAVHLACQSLLSGECDMVLAGGVSITVPQEVGYVYQEGGILSPDGHCRPFDAQSQGTVSGNGVGIVVLKRLSDALVDGDTIHSVIKGSALNNDGARKIGYTAPSVDGQASVIAEALAMADVDAASIGYIEAHGTATPLGDPIEVTALTQAFRVTTSATNFCALGSVKSNLGHLDAAAGVVGLIKAVLALSHARIPPTLHFTAPNPAIDFANSPFYVASTLRDWPSDGGPRRAGVSSFGIGGTNAHIVLEEAPPRSLVNSSGGVQLLTLSARTETALESATDRLVEHLVAHPELDLADVAHTLQVGRRAFSHRRTLVAHTRADAIAALQTRDQRRLRSAHHAQTQRPVAFMFPGQGAQYRHMGAGLYATEPVFKEEVDRCSDLLVPHLGFDLRDALYRAEGDLDQTAVAQPALFVIEHAMAQLLLSRGIRPAAMIGHSLGEYVAACVAGVLSVEDAVALVAARGRLMQSMPAGAMLAVLLPTAELETLVEPPLAIAAINAPSLGVVSGPIAAIDALEQRLLARGGMCRRLHTSHAFHSAMMEPILERFTARVACIPLQPPTIPFVSNLTGTWITDAQATDPAYWANHLRGTVRFADGIQTLMDSETPLVLEVGPGTTLSTLVRRQNQSIAVVESMRHPGDATPDEVVLLEALGRLWVSGVTLEVVSEGRRVPLPTYPFERQRYWIDAAVTKRTARKQADPSLWLHAQSWRRAPLLRTSVVDSEARRVVVADSHSRFATGLRDALTRSGQHVVELDAIDNLEPVHIVHTADFASLLRVMNAIGDRRARISIVSSGLYDVLGGELTATQLQPLAAAARIIPQEFPHATCAVFDLDTLEDFWRDHRRSESLIADLQQAVAGSVTAYRGGYRWLESFEPLPTVAPADAFRHAGVYLVANSAAQLTSELSTRYDARLMLLEPHDLQDSATLRELVATIQTDYGAIAGVIYAPPAADSCAIAELDADALQVQLGRIERELGVLDEALSDLVLDFKLVFSSLSTIVGGSGQFAAAASCLVAEAVAQQRSGVAAEAFARQRGGRWRSVAWDALVPAGESLEVVKRAFASADGAHVIVSTLDLEARLADVVQPHEIAPAHERPALEAPYAAPTSDLELTVAGIWQDLLGIDRVGVHDNFFELGGHSLLATQLLSRIHDACGVELPLNSLFEMSTVAELAAAVAARQSDGSESARIPLPRRDSSLDTAPLSFAQQRLWFLDRLEAGSAAYVVPSAVRLSGPLDVALLETCLQQVVDRHEALRTTFEVADGAPIQRVVPHVDVKLQVHHLASLNTDPPGVNGGEPVDNGSLGVNGSETVKTDPLGVNGVDSHGVDDESIHTWLRERSQRGFDLTKGPLMRAELLRISDDEHVLLLSLHHIVSDGWSLGVLVRELAALYEGTKLPELPIQYADFALWQREQLQGERLDSLTSYWRSQLEGTPPLLELPTDRPRPAVQTYRGATLPVTLTAQLTKQLKDLSQQQGATLYMTLLTGFQALLARYSGRTDLVVGSPIANRTRSETEGLIGLFVNTLVMRTDLSGNPSFTEAMQRVRDVALGAYAHQDMPFEKLVELLQPERNLSHTPLVQVLFALQNAPLPPLELPGLRMAHYELESGAAKLDMTLSLEERDNQLTGSIEYNTDLFDRSTIERLLGHFQNLLSAAVSHPHQPFQTLALLSDTERDHQLTAWNATDVDYGAARCLHELIQDQIERTPEASAVVFENERLTYRELDTKANQLAHHLRELGVRPDTLVAVCLDRSLELVVALLGILKAGGAYVPLDPGYPADRLAFMLDDCQAPVLVTHPELAHELPTDSVTVVCVGADLSGYPVGAPEAGVTPDHLAYMIYTSGSTGRPKGAMNAHRGIVNRLLWMQQEYGLTPADRVLQKTPYSFDVSVWEFFWPLLTGATLVMARPDGHRDPAYLVDVIVEQGITTLHFVPSMLSMFLEHSDVERTESLRRVMCSGEALPVSLQDRFHDRIRTAALHNLYGPTEAAVDVTYWACRRDQPLDSVPIGRPIANTQIYILDAALQPVPIGVTGELYIGGIGVGRGYLRRPALTAEKFNPDPFSATVGARMYRTGDLACYRPDGAIVYLGRTDHQVKVRGFRIELGEIETALSQHPAIREAVVIADGAGPTDARLIAYVVGDQPSASAAELRAFLRNSLPEYMLPGAFVALEALPTTPNGKLDRRALPSPDGSRTEVEATYVAARSELEHAISSVWRDVLQVDRVGIRDNFFDLGGHSLLIIQVQSRLSQVLGRDIELVELFNHPNVELLAAHLSATQREPEVTSVASLEEGKARLKQRLSRMKSVVAYDEGDD